jgi:hypothetical protein
LGEIADIFWPESENDEASTYFYRTSFSLVHFSRPAKLTARAFVCLFGLSVSTEILQGVINYILAKVSEEINEDFIGYIDANYGGFVESVQRLSALIKTNDNPVDRGSKFSDLQSMCNQFMSDMQWLLTESGASPAALIPLLGNIGSSCIAIDVTAAFHYEAATGLQINNATQQLYQKYLDYDIETYTKMMESAANDAIAYRIGNITEITSCSDSGCRCQHDDWE